MDLIVVLVRWANLVDAHILKACSAAGCVMVRSVRDRWFFACIVLCMPFWAYGTRETFGEARSTACHACDQRVCIEQVT